MTKAVRIIAGIAVGMLLVACASPATDKSGASTIVLHLATIDGQVNSNGYQHGPAAFVRALSEVSGDRIQVDVAMAYGGEGAAADAESDLVRAIAEGDVDGGWPASRAFAGAGIAGLAAIEAPLTITSYDAQRELAEGEGSRLVTASLEDSGVKGLGLSVGPLRRPFGVEKFPLSSADWKGMRFRSYSSPVQTATVTALGGTAVEVGTDWTTAAAAGELDGIEFDVAQYYANGYGSQAGRVVSNIVLWPEMFVLAINEELWDGLTAQQRGWIQTAADRAVEASVAGDYPDDEIAWQLCPRGARFRAAEPGEVLAVHEAVEPVVDALADDAVEAPLLRAVQDAAEVHPQQDAITVQDSCTTEATLPESDVPTTLAPIPDGTYRKQIEVEDVTAAGLQNNDGTSGTWTLKVMDGRWYVSCRPLSAPGEDCGRAVEDGVLDAGWFYGDDRVVWMVPDSELLADATGCMLPPDGSNEHCHPPGPPAQLEWSLDADNLLFSSSSLSLGFEIILKPYVRID